jgi:hypothetical protein
MGVSLDLMAEDTPDGMFPVRKMKERRFSLENLLFRIC